MYQEVVLGGEGQRFVLDPPGGRPSWSATVTVKSSRGIVQAATLGSCVIDPVETALTDVASIGETSLSLASTAGIAPGTRYQLVDPDGAHEWVVVVAVDPSRVTTRRPLVNRFAPGSILGGCQISIAIDPSWSSAVANLTDQLDVQVGYRLHWSYSIAGVATSTTTTADLVRVPQHGRVSAADVDRRFPGWIEKLPSAYRESGGSELIAEAFELVNRDVLEHPEIRRARDAAVLRELAIIRANFVELEHASLFEHASSASLREAEQRYRQRFDELVREAKENRSPPPTIAPPLDDKDDPPYSLAHVSTIDALMEWLAANPINKKTKGKAFIAIWIPRLRTADERTVAIKLINASVRSPRLRDSLIVKIARGS